MASTGAAKILVAGDAFSFTMPWPSGYEDAKRLAETKASSEYWAKGKAAARAS